MNSETQSDPRNQNGTKTTKKNNRHSHGQETRDFSAAFPFLNWRPPLRLIDQLAIYFYVDLEVNMILYRSTVADVFVLKSCMRICSLDNTIYSQ